MAGESPCPHGPSRIVVSTRPLDRRSVSHHAGSRPFFAEPGERPLAFDDWVKVWKSGAARILKTVNGAGRPGAFTIGFRSHEDHSAKRTYVDENPVRAGLVKRVEDWPYRGELFRRFDWWP
jgi:hypothetical protein